MSGPDHADDRCVAALLRLERLRAPGELAGRVVAALEAGAREDRVVRAVTSLPALPAPTVLTRLSTKAVDPLRAPQDLDKRVAGLMTERVLAEGPGTEERCAEGPAGRAGETEGATAGIGAVIGGLARRAAPAALAARLASPGGLVSRSVAAEARSLWLRRSGALATAAMVALLVFVVAPPLARDSGGVDPAAPSALTQPRLGHSSIRPRLGHSSIRPRLELSFEFVGHRSFDEAPLAAQQRAFAGALVGELLGGGS